MGNPVIAAPLSDAAALTPSSEAGDMLADNLQADQPSDKWRTTTAATVNLVVDLGEFKDVNFATLLYANPSGNDGHNLLRWSEAFDNAVWADPNTQWTVVADTELDPNGVATADVITVTGSNALIRHVTRDIVNDSPSFSIWAKVISGSINIFECDYGDSGVQSVLSQLSAGNWVRVQAPNLTNSSPAKQWLDMKLGFTVAGGQIALWGGQLNLGPTVNSYGKTTSIRAATWRVRAADTQANLTAAPGYDSGTLTAWSQSGLGDWPFVHLLHWIGSTQRFRWWRFDVEDADNADGYFQAGRLILADAWQSSRGFDYGRGTGFMDPSSVAVAAGGQLWPQRREPRRSESFNIPLLPEDEFYGRVFPLDLTRGAARPVLMMTDPDSAWLQSQTIYGLMQPRFAAHQAFARFGKPFVIEEMI